MCIESGAHFSKLVAKSEWDAHRQSMGILESQNNLLLNKWLMSFTSPIHCTADWNYGLCHR